MNDAKTCKVEEKTKEETAPQSQQMAGGQDYRWALNEITDGHWSWFQMDGGKDYRWAMNEITDGHSSWFQMSTEQALN